MSESVQVASSVSGAREAVKEFIFQHVLYHHTDVDQWNIPFVHLRFLDVFRSDAFMLFLGAALLVAMAAASRKGRGEVPKGWANAGELFVKFIRDHIAVQFLGPEDGRRLTPLLCSLFLFIMCMNLLGLVPIFSAPTSNLSVTGALALVTAAFMVFGALVRNGPAGLLRAFMTPGVPAPMQLFMVPMEIVSTVSKVGALMIRLFANMLAGHIVIFAMIGMVVIIGWYALPAVLFAVAVFFFELFVSCFQAYIFTLLSAVFIGQTYHPHH